MNEFAFESYGVRVRVECSDAGLLETALAVVRRTLLDRIAPIDRAKADHVFTLSKKGSRYFMDLNGEDLGDNETEWVFFKYFDTRIRLLIAEHAVGFVFMHAGVVAWNDKALIFPADSYSGKTTLVYEFVKKGAIYYSDEYAVFDRYGNVHAFPRMLSVRDEGGNYKKTDLSVESFGGIKGVDPKPVSLVLLTKYRCRARWNPVILTPGLGLMKMMPQAISLRFHSKFTIEVLNQITKRAIIAESLRSGATTAVNKIIDFVDNL